MRKKEGKGKAVFVEPWEGLFLVKKPPQDAPSSVISVPTPLEPKIQIHSVNPNVAFSASPVENAIPNH